MIMVITERLPLHLQGPYSITPVVGKALSPLNLFAWLRMVTKPLEIRFTSPIKWRLSSAHTDSAKSSVATPFILLWVIQIIMINLK